MSSSQQIPAFGIVWAVLLAGSLSGAAQVPSATPTGSPTTVPQSAATTQAAPAPKPGTYQAVLLHPEALNEKAPDEFEVKFVTTAGDFTVKVTRAWAPNGADRFYNLVRHHFYDGSAFFRVVRGFMAQFGWSPYPPVNVAWIKANIKDDPVKQSNRRGYITFAMSSEPNSRSTQVFINFVDNPALDMRGFAPFGLVTEGMESVSKIYSGYGESEPDGNGPRQNDVAGKGHFYLEKNYPKLDVVRSASLITPDAAPAGIEAPAK